MKKISLIVLDDLFVIKKNCDNITLKRSMGDNQFSLIDLIDLIEGNISTAFKLSSG